MFSAAVKGGNAFAAEQKLTVLNKEYLGLNQWKKCRQKNKTCTR